MARDDNPFDDLQRLSEKMDRLFDGFFEHRRWMVPLTGEMWRPLADVYETDEAVLVKIELPGVPQEAIQIVYENGQLVVRGERRREVPTGTSSCQQIEVSYGRFERAIPIRTRIDYEREMTARYQNGFLEVVLPKVRQPVVRQIQVEIE